MKVIDPGHVYELAILDDEGWKWPWEELNFVKRKGPGYPGNKNHHPGTTMQEVLRVLIDRTKYLNNQIPDGLNEEVIHHLRRAIEILEDRAARRHGRTLLFLDNIPIDERPTCSKCLHIGCGGECHPTKMKKEVEKASTVVCQNDGDGVRHYWTGNHWSDDLKEAERYPRAEAVTLAGQKQAFTITIGSIPKEN